MTQTQEIPTPHDPQRIAKPRTRAILLGFLSGVLFLAGFPPIGIWISIFFAPIPLFMIAIRPGMGIHRAGFYAAIGTAPAWFWLHQWIANVSAMGLFPLVLYLSIYTWLFLWVGHRTIRRWGGGVWALPFVWVGIEFARGVVIWTGYPWYFVGHPMIEPFEGLLALPASVGGVYLVSLLVTLVSAGMTGLLIRASWKSSVFGAAGVLVGWSAVALVLDANAMSSDSTPIDVIRIGVVQPNVPQDNRMNWTTRQRVSDWLDLRNLTYELSRQTPAPELIVWPEGLVPGWTLDPVSLEVERNAGVAWMLDLKFPGDVDHLDLPSAIGATMIVDEMLLMQEAIDIPMIVGSVAYDNLQIKKDESGIEYSHDAMYNSAFVLHGGQPLAIWYDKLHLTPFGEVMPYISAWPWLENQLLGLGAQGMSFVLSPGADARVLRVPVHGREIAIATPICFEATLPAVCRDLVFSGGVRRARFMVNITNDGWFGDWTAGRRSHELMTRWRCIELATPMVRCANTGISGVIDDRGQIVPIDFVEFGGIRSGTVDKKAGGFVSTIELATRTTPYSQYGDLPGWVLFSITLLGGFVIKKPRSASAAGRNAEKPA